MYTPEEDETKILVVVHDINGQTFVFYREESTVEKLTVLVERMFPGYTTNSGSIIYLEGSIQIFLEKK